VGSSWAHRGLIVGSSWAHRGLIVGSSWAPQVFLDTQPRRRLCSSELELELKLKLKRQTELLVKQEHLQVARLIAHLAEVSLRRLHLELGYRSLFEYGVKCLDGIDVPRIHHWHHWGGPTANPSHLVSPHRLTPVSSPDRLHVVRLASGNLHVRLLGSDGVTPLLGVPLIGKCGEWSRFDMRCDQSGEVVHPALQAGEWRLWVQSKKRPLAGGSKTRVLVGSVVVVPGAKGRVSEFVLPRSSGY
jgi:hypothetical protein